MRDNDTNNSKGFAFINFASFDAADAALEAMNGQYLCNRPITISYAFKKDSKGERHGTEAERFLAAQNPLPIADRPHQLFADTAPSAHPGGGMSQQQMPPVMPGPPMMQMMPAPPTLAMYPGGPMPPFGGAPMHFGMPPMPPFQMGFAPMPFGAMPGPPMPFPPQMHNPAMMRPHAPPPPPPGHQMNGLQMAPPPPPVPPPPPGQPQHPSRLPV